MQTVGYCPFCGQGVQIDAPDTATKEEREQIAALNCGCDGAKEKRAALELARKVRRNIRELFGKGTKEDEERNAEIVSYLLKGGQMVCDSDFEKITISLWGGVKATISKTSKGGVKVERKDTQTRQLIE